MKYSYNERLRIGKEIYTHKYSCYEASIKYGIHYYTARDYLRQYKAELKLNNVENIVIPKVEWVNNQPEIIIDLEEK